ncbi:MAG: hypothetical protein K9G39_06445, partial [Chlorobium sp.]|uniref:hypothetical protein n=1 Tax=Chlorobium sp. TaxID=1095 RepID=UPI0025BF3D8B
FSTHPQRKTQLSRLSFTGQTLPMHRPHLLHNGSSKRGVCIFDGLVMGRGEVFNETTERCIKIGILFRVIKRHELSPYCMGGSAT